MKALFRYKYQALLAAQSAAGYTYESTADAETLDTQDPKLQQATVFSCLRSSDGDVFAWWEESPTIYFTTDEDGEVTLDKSKLTKAGYFDDEIVAIGDENPAYLDLIKYLE